jgi:hypothetical protein
MCKWYAPLDAPIVSCEQKIPSNIFLGNEKYLNCDQKNKKNFQIKIIIHDSIYGFFVVWINMRYKNSKFHITFSATFTHFWLRIENLTSANWNTHMS